MKSYHSFKKIALFGGLLIAATSLTTLIAVSCSSASNPAILTATNYSVTEGSDVQTIKIADKGNVSLEPGVKFGDVTYKTLPKVNNDASQVSINDQKAVAYFRNIVNFSLWLQTFLIETQNFYSATPTLLTSYHQGFNVVQDFAYGLAAPLNEGTKTARLGLKSVTFNSNIHSHIERYFKPYDGTNFVDEKAEISWINNISNIQLQYNWWTTDKSNAIYWQADNWDVLSQNLSLWNKFNAKPQSVYKYTLDDLMFDSLQTPVKKDDKWIFNGVTAIKDPANAFYFKNVNDKKLTQNIYAFLADADKHHRGDILNGSFEQFVRNSDQITVKNFTKVITKRN